MHPILQFIEPPKPKGEEVENVNVLMGDTLELVCQIHGIPEPKIHWEIPEVLASINMNTTIKKLVSHVDSTQIPKIICFFLRRFQI